MLRSIYFAVILVVLFGLVSTASARPVQGKWWENEDLVKKIKITQEQQDKINKIFNDSQNERKGLRAKGKELRTELDNILSKPALDQKKFDQALSQYNAARNKIFAEMVEMKLKIRKVFTLEQTKLLLAEYPRLFNLNVRWTRPAFPKGKRTRMKAPTGKQ